ncbi:DMT family transporter [Paraglaciecola sp. MB-3u-78]|uniref:DMT family transporter n=1 Tax=Paraglaciecola sp. MB-3u-78 TaxID=2058332 RepID=UPI00350F25A5
MNTPQAILLTLVSLFAFAANSVLCRLALSIEQVHPADFTAIRLLSAALTLAFIVAVKNTTNLRKIGKLGSHAGAIYLFIYAAGFSYAYVTLGTATGALILFACVQFTMLLKGWLAGVKMSKQECGGIVLSLLGFLYFIYPELEKPSLIGCLLMGLAGIAWAMYSLIGARSTQPLLDTASNFVRLLPIVIIALVWIYFTTGLQISLQGWLYTIASGALASGVGYAVWYAVLPHLKPSIAAVSQLSVPIWAALGGVLLVAEPISLHLTLSASVILGGILLVILTKGSIQTK